MLHIEHLTKAYGDKKAVDDLTLHIAPGEIYGFIGHNGAGKTTTLKSIAGILHFDGGDITIDGLSIQKEPIACKQRIAYIPDNPDLYDFMTGIQFLNFIADIFGLDAGTRESRIAEYSASFELTEDLAQPISAYSHGMKRLDPRAEAHPHGRTLRGAGPQGLPPAENHDALFLRRGRRHLLLHPRAGGGGKALR